MTKAFFDIKKNCEDLNENNIIKYWGNNTRFEIKDLYIKVIYIIILLLIILIRDIG